MRIVTRYDVNIRSGPGMAFEIIDTAKRATEFQATEFRKDEGRIGWYKTSKGWICGKYVTLAKDYVATTKEDPDDMDLQKNASISLGGLTRDVSSISQQINNGRQYANSRLTDAVGGLIPSFDELLYGSLGGEGQGDIYLGRRIFGEPYQYRDTVDIRNPRGYDMELGVSYLEAIAESPFISVMPGQSLFLPDLSNEQRQNYFDAFDSIVNEFTESATNAGTRLTKTAAEGLLNSSNTDIRYFTFQPNYVDYIRYVNTLCWMFAVFLGIDQMQVPGTDKLYGNFDWAEWHLSNGFANRPTNKDSLSFGTSASVDSMEQVMSQTASAWEKIGAGLITGDADTAGDALGSLLAVYNAEDMYTDFFINPSVSYSETFSNTTKQSMLSNVLSGASEFSKEMAFLLASGVPEADVSQSQQNLSNMVQKIKDSLGGNGNGIISRVLGAASTVITGSNIVFPELWASSDYSRSYNIEINLKTPYGSREEIYKNIIVPMCHWICLAAPKQNTVNTYSAPFLCRFFIPGYCAVDMGIVESLSISKGGDGSAWSVDGLPLEVQLSINIKDLYNSFSMSRINAVAPVDIYNMLWNTALIDYVSVNSGLNMKQSEWRTKIELAKTLGQNSLSDIFVYPQDKVRQALATTSLNGFAGSK